MGLMKCGWGQAIFKGICVFLFAVGVGVNVRGAEDAKGKALSEGVAKLVESFNASGVELYGNLASDLDNTGKNIVVSPYSIGMAMSMALTGARGATYAEMAKVLHQGLDREKMDKACGELNDTLGKMKNKELDIAVANALCLTKFGDVVKDSYKELLKRDYRAKLFDAKAVDPINAWVAEKTQGKIKNILKGLHTLSMCVLLNSMYFKGDWVKDFPARRTGKRPFHYTAMGVVEVSMMSQTNSFAMVECDGFRALSMPFKGGNISMVVLLPDKMDGLSDLEKSLTAANLADTLSKLRKSQSRDLCLTLPKFNVAFGADLIPPFKALGMKSPFGTSANFGGMASVPSGALFINQVRHKICMKVDEQGVEAATTSTAGIALGCSMLSFRADHPFMFAIVENKTGAVLFLGRIVNPTGVGKLVRNLKLPMVFGDGMVLQRGMNVPVWGWAKPGSRVTVEFAGQKKTAKADAKGKWRVDLASLKLDAKGSDFKVSSGGEAITLKDVVVGEVWFCTGQSNMDFTARSFMGPKSNPAAAAFAKRVAELNDPIMRQYAAPYALGHDGRKEKADVSHHRNIGRDGKRDMSLGHWIKATSPDNTTKFTGTGLCFALALRDAMPGVPIGLIKCAWGGTPVEPWIPTYVFDANPKMKAEREKYIKGITARYEKWKTRDWEPAYQKKLKEWEAKHKDDAKNKKKRGRRDRKPSPPRNPLDPPYPNYPCTLFNAMLAPLIPYAGRGFIWYQGESNAFISRNQHPSYGKRMAMMIKSWREEWGNENMSFYIVQLANFISRRKSSDGDRWAIVMDQQRRVLDMLPRTGMSVTIDIGDPHNIHPRNKMDVGKRLALWALKLDYGKKNIPECSGPLYKGLQVKDGKVLLSFTHADSGLMVAHKDGIDPAEKVVSPLTWFEVRGEDGEWHKADARIVDGNKVEVSSSNVPKPVAVRYAWSCNPEGANLYNKAGLPASPFTTEAESEK